MKAVGVLLCLALPASIVGSIFNRQYAPQRDSLLVQNLDYINQQQYQQRELKRQHQKYQPDQNQEQYQPDPYQQLQYQQKQKIRQYQAKPHSSSESQSDESKERIAIDSQEHVALRSGSQNWNVPLFSTVRKDQQNVPYGDVISWRGVKMAVGPKSPVQTKKDIETIFQNAYASMNHVSEEDKQKFDEAYETAAHIDNEDTRLNATQLLNKYQYQVEEHTIKTDDGYYLTLFRIPPKQYTRDVQKRPVVFLMHGLLGSADDWLLMGPGKSLAYLLADAGYDVWLGNARGNKYSRRHASKHPAQNDFWQFTLDEIALHDLPAMIDHALKISEQQKMYYVGYSLGTTAFFALAATRPVYSDKITMMYALSPMVYMTGVRSPLFRMIAPNSPFYELLHEQLGHGEFKPNQQLIKTVGGTMLENEIGCKNISSNVNFVISGVNVENLDVSLIPVIMKHLPAGTSTRLMKHYGQAVASNEFRKYDYGSMINRKVYGDIVPPSYKMQQVQTPVALYYTEQDWLAHPDDVQRLYNELPNVKEYYKVEDAHFTNMDFQFSEKAPQAVYTKLIESIQKNYTY